MKTYNQTALYFQNGITEKLNPEKLAHSEGFQILKAIQALNENCVQPYVATLEQLAKLCQKSFKIFDYGFSKECRQETEISLRKLQMIF